MSSDQVTIEKPSGKEAARPKYRPARPAAGAAGAKRRGLPMWAAVTLALVVGFGAGAVVMRQRYKAKDVIVAVNGQVIDKSELFRRLEMAGGAAAMRQMIAEELQVQFAKSQGVPVEKRVEVRYAEASKRPRFDENLARAGQSPGDYKRALEVQESKAGLAAKGLTITEQDARRFYDANASHSNPQARYYLPETAQVAVIMTASAAAAKQAQAELDRGAAFGAVAQKYSRDRSAANGGLLPPVVRGRNNLSKIPGMEQAIFGLKIGEQLGPRPFGPAWCILRCLDKQSEQTIPYEQVREECRAGAMLTKGLPVNGAKEETEFRDFQRKALIQAFWPQYKGVASTQ